MFYAKYNKNDEIKENNIGRRFRKHGDKRNSYRNFGVEARREKTTRRTKILLSTPAVLPLGRSQSHYDRELKTTRVW